MAGVACAWGGDDRPILAHLGNSAAATGRTLAAAFPWHSPMRRSRLRAASLWGLALELQCELAAAPPSNGTAAFCLAPTPRGSRLPVGSRPDAAAMFPFQKTSRRHRSHSGGGFCMRASRRDRSAQAAALVGAGAGRHRGVGSPLAAIVHSDDAVTTISKLPPPAWQRPAAFSSTGAAIRPAH